MAALEDFTSTLARLRPALPGSGSASRVRVEIIADGTSAGSRELPEGIFRIGAKADCDLIIPEAKAPHIATLKVEKSPAGVYSVTLVPFAEGILLDGRALAAFNPVTISKAVSLTVGATMLRFSPLGMSGALGEMVRHAGQKASAAANKAGGTGRIGSLSGPPVAEIGLNAGSPVTTRRFLLLAGFLFLAALASSFWDSFGASVLRGSSIAATSTDPKLDDANDVLKLARQQLAVADLGDHIKVRLEGNSIVLDGAVTERQEDRYRALLPALRRRSGIELRSNVRAVAMPMQSQVAGIALEPIPMLIMQGGERYQVGDTLPQDWRVDSITTQGVVLSRGALRETIPLGGGR